MSERNEFLGILAGIGLLLACHVVFVGLVFALGIVIAPTTQNYAFVVVWMVGWGGLFLWQLLYALPLILWFRRRQNPAMAKGILICAIATALLNGTCSLLMFGSSL